MGGGVHKYSKSDTLPENCMCVCAVCGARDIYRRLDYRTRVMYHAPVVLRESKAKVKV